MKKVVLLLLLALSTGLFAQNQTLRIGKDGTMDNETVLLLQQNEATTIRFDLAELELVEVDTGNGRAFIATSTAAPLMLEKGSPELFYMTASFIIPDTGDSELEISYGRYRDYENIEIAPSKGNFSRSIDPNTVPYEKGEVYKIDEFFPGILAELREPFIMRDFRGQSVDVYPLQYNPVTKILRVYSEITVTVHNTSAVGMREFTDNKRHKTIDPEFHAIYGNLFINHTGVIKERGYPTGEEGEILIICHGPFMDAMQPYVDWKRTIGRKTTIVNVADVGSLTAANIWTYIKNYYDNPNNNLAYVLLVGDMAQIPARTYNSSAHSNPSLCVSDNYFGQLSGTVTSPSTYMDILIGRMSSETVAHVETQVQRTIWYERDITESDTWLGTAIGIASAEGAGGNGHDGSETDHQHMNNIRNRLLTYGYNPVYQEYVNYGSTSCGVTPTTTAQISSRFNSGAGIANYCNHGSEVAWTLATGPYSYLTYGTGTVNQLTNDGKLPYIFSVACLNGRFNHVVSCFAEAWMRRVNNGQPAGAVATLMASLSISWAPPMTAQDEFVNIVMDLGSHYPSNGGQPGIKRSFAGAAINATQKALLRHGTSAVNLGDFNSWNVFGDPSLMIRTKTPQAMTVTYSPTINIEATQITVNCNVDGASVTLSHIENGQVEILGTETISGGSANIPIDIAVSSPSTITVAVTARDRVTHIGTITINQTGEDMWKMSIAICPEGAGTVTGDYEYPAGADVTITAYANPNYEFEAWYDEDMTEIVKTEIHSFTMPDNDLNYIAMFRGQEKVITADVTPEGSGIVEGADIYIYNTSATLTAIANDDDGYEFNRWIENSETVTEATEATYTFTVLGDRDLTAEFILKTYTIQILAETGGTVGGSIQVTHGTSVTVTATANTGYVFARWEENGVPVPDADAEYTFIATSDRTLTAYFERVQYQVTITSIGNGTLTVEDQDGNAITSGMSIDYGTDLTIAALPETGHNVTTLTVNDEPLATSIYKVEGITDIYCVFTIKYYAVTLLVNNENYGTTEGADSYPHNEEITVRAISKDGYQFDNWTDEDDLEVSKEAEYTFFITEDITLTANFSDLVGIARFGISGDFVIFPNPVRDILKVARSTAGNARIEVFNSSGSLVYTTETQYRETEIDVSAYVAGVYLIRLTNENSSTIQRFVKKL